MAGNMPLPNEKDDIHGLENIRVSEHQCFCNSQPQGVCLKSPTIFPTKALSRL